MNDIKRYPRYIYYKLLIPLSVEPLEKANIKVACKMIGAFLINKYVVTSTGSED